LKNQEDFEQELLFAHDLAKTDANRIQNIFEINYFPADLPKTLSECNFLDTSEKERLHKLLAKFLPLFDGTQGKWRTNIVELDLEKKV
jgi:hypothetical protein